MKKTNAAFALLIALSGCSTAASPGATLWAGLNSYHDEMRTLEGRPERWPERQRMAESIKAAYVATLGGSREFNRLVDLDLRKRELVIALRGGLKPERIAEIDKELVEMNGESERLIKVVKDQVSNSQLGAQDPAKPIETVATIGLLNLAIDAFSPMRAGAGTATTKVGPYVVIEQGFMSTVQTPDGKVFRCATTLVPEAGAVIHCEPAGGKP